MVGESSSDKIGEKRMSLEKNPTSGLTVEAALPAGNKKPPVVAGGSVDGEMLALKELT